MKVVILMFSIITIVTTFNSVQAQTGNDSTKSIAQVKKFQAKAPVTKPFGTEAFKLSDKTTLRWLGMAGFFINSRGTTLMIDPLLEGYDMPLLIKFPIAPKDIPHLDAVLVTHSDNDHYSILTCKDVLAVTTSFHSTIYVDSLMKNERFPSFGHGIGEIFKVGATHVKLTPADHAWQNAYHASKRFFKLEDACGFWIETPDGNIWASGDSRLMPEQLNMPIPDAILLDFSEDNEWHFGLEGSIKIANAYPNTPIILGHWGSVDAPDFIPFNGNPKHLIDRVVNPARIMVLAPGEPFTLNRIKK